MYDVSSSLLYFRWRCKIILVTNLFGRVSLLQRTISFIFHWSCHCAEKSNDLFYLKTFIKKKQKKYFFSFRTIFHSCSRLNWSVSRCKKKNQQKTKPDLPVTSSNQIDSRTVESAFQRNTLRRLHMQHVLLQRSHQFSKSK